MNQQIIKLAQQAGIIGESETALAPTVEQFAELIVQRCLSAVDGLIDRNEDGSWTTDELYTDYNGALHLVEYEIRKTFGVEE